MILFSVHGEEGLGAPGPSTRLTMLTFQMDKRTNHFKEEEVLALGPYMGFNA